MSDNDLIKRGDVRRLWNTIPSSDRFITTMTTEELNIGLDAISPVEQPMRADVYLWQRERMCHSFDKATYDPSIDECEACPLIDCCSKRGRLEGAEAVDIIEKWAREHPERSEE